jgi:hypothetical protein
MANKSTSSAADGDFERQMAVAREIMEKDWVALRALALGDQHPELDVTARLKIAEQEKRKRDKQSKP